MSVTLPVLDLGVPLGGCNCCSRSEYVSVLPGFRGDIPRCCTFRNLDVAVSIQFK